MILMIDKSLSMAEAGKFDSLQQWVQDQLVSQMIIEGDWVSVFQFYERPEKLLETTITDSSNIEETAKAIASISPDGAYTDIGLALDRINETLEPRKNNGRHKVMLLLTDLKQEAPWGSRYAGVVDEYSSPYLAQARILQHDNWYEITLDMDIQNAVAAASRSIFTMITERTDSAEETSIFDRIDVSLSGEASTNENADQETGTAGASPDAGVREAAADPEAATAGTGTASTGSESGKHSGTSPGTALPQKAVPVLVSLCLAAALAVPGMLLLRKKKQSKQEKSV